MKIVCPFCRTEREIEHICGPRNIECLCGRKFPLNKKCIREEFSAIDLQIPEFIGRYKILDYIGCGGMGKVYLAHHPDLGLAVALKMLRQEYSNDAASCSRFMRSAKISAKLNHPNVVRIYDCCRTENNELFLVMEYISGGSTLDILHDKGPLPPEKTARIALQVCAGLIEAENKKIVHRDIKPENIMFDSDGTIKLLDLGLARLSESSKDNTSFLSDTKVNTTLGTPEYCSPEQLLDAKSCDRRSDIYSLGAAMYHLLTAKYPFGTGTAEELRKRQYSTDLLPPGIYKSSIPPEMDRIVMKCMEKNRSDRYQSAVELSGDLKNFLDSSKKSDSRFTSFSLWLKRRETAFNAKVFRKLPFWKYPAEKTPFFSPFRLMIFLTVIILAGGFSAGFFLNYSEKATGIQFSKTVQSKNNNMD